MRSPTVPGERSKHFKSPSAEIRWRRFERASDLCDLHGSQRMLRNGCAHVLIGRAESVGENCAVSVGTTAAVWGKIGKFRQRARQS
jgi:hypothetical protein